MHDSVKCILCKYPVNLKIMLRNEIYPHSQSYQSHFRMQTNKNVQLFTKIYQDTALGSPRSACMNCNRPGSGYKFRRTLMAPMFPLERLSTMVTLKESLSRRSAAWEPM